MPPARNILGIQNRPYECHTSVTKSHEFASHLLPLSSLPLSFTEVCQLMQLRPHFTSVGHMVDGTSEFNTAVVLTGLM